MSSSRIAPQDRIPVGQKAAFAAGENMNYLCTGLMSSVLWMPYFNIGLGMSPAVLGLVLMFYRVWDAITDPIIGNWSDNTRTRWGRRRPFMFAGAILTAVAFPLFWHIPAGFGDGERIAWLLGMGALYYTFYTLFSMPYYGLQLELTPSYDERTRLAAWCAYAGKFSSLCGSWIMAVITSSLFLDSVSGKPDIVRGTRVVSLWLAGVILVVGLLPALFVKERYYAAEASRQPKTPLWQSIRESVGCRSLWCLIGISFCLVLGYYAVGNLGSYLNIYYVNDGDLAAAAVIGGWKGTVTMITGLVCIPLWIKLGERHDKKTMVGAMLLVSVFGHLLNYVCLTPRHPYLQIVSSVFESGAISAIWIFLPSMKADTADADELETRRRREGSINSFYSWFIKVAGACSAGLGGFVLNLTGFDVKLPRQPPEVLGLMLHVYVLLPILIWGAGFFFLWRYRLGRDRMREIRAALETRRGAL